jgi:pilus assembly protein CpaB
MPIPKLPKKFLPIIIAAGAGLLAIFLLNTYLKQREEEIKKRAVLIQKELVTVVVAKEDIPAGTALKENMLKEETVNRALLQPRAATSIDRVSDKIAIAPISKGEQILLNKVTISGEATTLSHKVPKGKRAVTIAVDNISSVGGMLRPGDRVDVVGMVPWPVMTAEGKQATQMTSVPLFQDVLVLAVGQDFTYASTPSVSRGGEKEKIVSPIITLALSPEEANLITFVQEQGKIRLTLRSPEDTQVQPVMPASWDTLFKVILPPPPVEERPAVKPEIKVEIYRGLQKEVKVLE